MSMFTTIRTLSATALIALGACGGSDGPTSAPRDPGATLVPDQVQARIGSRLTYSLRNSGGVALTYKPCVVSAQRLLSAGWTDIDLPTDWQDCTATSHVLETGSSEKISIIVPLSLVPGGTYRIALDMKAKKDGGDVPLTEYSLSFAVLNR